jgi:hypothetical protein
MQTKVRTRIQRKETIPFHRYVITSGNCAWMLLVVECFWSWMSSHAMKHYSKYNFRLLYHWLAYSLVTFSTIYHNHIHSADEDSKSAVKSCFLLFMILIAIFFFTSTMADEVTLLNFWASMSVVNRTWATERVICFCRWIQFTRRFQFSSAEEN